MKGNMSMKHKLFILISCLFLVMSLSACRNDSPKERHELPITYFTAYSTIVQTESDSFLLIKGDSQNFRLWIDSCPIIEKIDSDISNNWDYRITFCDAENIITENSYYFIPHTATTHVVYINEVDNVIQFDNVAYSLEPPEINKMSFYDGIRTYLINE